MHDHPHELTLGLAFFLGALHAIEPGHGKTAMLVYLSDERRSYWHPVVMGVSSGLAHSVSLIGIAMAVHLTHHLVLGDHGHDKESVTLAFQWLSACLVLCVGMWMLWSARRTLPAKCGCKHHHADESNMKKESSGASYSMSALLGAAFGLLPCPSALAAYFTSMSSGTPVAAYTVIGLFAAGIATSLTLVGMLLQRFSGTFLRDRGDSRSIPWKYIRAGIIIAIGLFYTCRLLAIA